MTRKTVCVLFLISLVAMVSEALAQYPYAVPVRPRVASKMVAMDKATPATEVEKTKTTVEKTKTKVKKAKVEAPEVEEAKVEAPKAVAQPVQKAAPKAAQTVPAKRSVTPTQAHTGYTRSEIRSMPILERPNRPGHFYGNTVRRRAGVYNY